MLEYLKGLRSQFGFRHSVDLVGIIVIALLLVGAVPEVNKLTYMESAVLGGFILIAFLILFCVWNSEG